MAESKALNVDFIIAELKGCHDRIEDSPTHLRYSRIREGVVAESKSFRLAFIMAESKIPLQLSRTPFGSTSSWPNNRRRGGREEGFSTPHRNGRIRDFAVAE